ncbi:MAG: YaiO family outer membrane beta-barrel protein [Acidobacteriota bacterium]
MRRGHSMCVSNLRVLIAVSVLASALAIARPVLAQDDVLAKGRDLATSGRRDEAIAIMVAHLAGHPDDVDVRTLLGLVYTWEGRYADARTELRRVLGQKPGYYDATAALVYTELWSGHNALSLSLADDVLGRNPRDTSMLLAKARALSALNRVREAVDALDRLLEVDPRHEQGGQMRERLLDSQRHWGATVGYAYDWFDDGRDPWQEYWVAVRRKAGFGSFSLTASQADRYTLTDRQFELEFYPRLRRGTYMYLDAGFADAKTLYPDYRAGAHLYQSLGKGFEVSAGMSRLGFGDGINIYIGSLSKYLGSWLLISQVFVTPKDIGTNVSWHGAFRYYFGDAQWFGLRYRHGAAKEQIRTIDDILILSSDGVSGELIALFGRRVEATLRGAWSREERFERSNLHQHSGSGQLTFRF